jgi:flagellar biosynthesis/type III secretory pathway protein FliH
MPASGPPADRRNGDGGGEPAPEPAEPAWTEAERAEELRRLEERHRAELEAAVEEARREARAEGREEGRREERQRVDRAVSALEGAVEEIEAARPEWFRAREDNLKALAMAAARHLVERELSQDADAISGLVRSAVAQFPLDEPLRVRIHPRDLSLVSAAGAADGDIVVGSGREIRWIPDPEVGRGGVFVEGPERLVDGRVDKALERIYQELRDD